MMGKPQTRGGRDARSPFWAVSGCQRRERDLTGQQILSSRAQGRISAFLFLILYDAMPEEKLKEVYFLAKAKYDEGVKAKKAGKGTGIKISNIVRQTDRIKHELETRGIEIPGIETEGNEK